jgi:F0F1-type ATP synthase epsilon subunit
VYYGECNTLFVPSENDMIAILAYHTPMIMKLGKGDVAIKTGREKRTLTVITGGLLYVGNNEVTVLVNL